MRAYHRPVPFPDPAGLPHPVRIGAAFWVQRTDWPSLREALETADAAGADDLWIDDHLLADEGDPETAKLEGWTTLAAAAAVTTRARLGLLVAANTIRNPGLTAKLATTLDQISAGRAILGLGGGWFAAEHEAFGLDFGSGFGERLDRLAESVDIIRRLLDGERFSHEGRFYRLRDALAAPRPIQAHLPILIGGPDRRRRSGSSPATPTCGTPSVRRPASPRPTRSWTSAVPRSAAIPPRSSGRST
jgi:alkanesulfonate monooxygenase SsuD/methylene tetrahydromethanopterin reductase-like flavin-dependent oxidoreductase (luciferase family)